MEYQYSSKTIQSNTIDLADAEKSHYILFTMISNIEKKISLYDRHREVKNVRFRLL